MSTDLLRSQLAEVLDWRSAHADLHSAVANLPPAQRGIAPVGLPYTPWQLVEHIRLAQADMLAFCIRPDYEEGTWPDDYWPATSAPPDPDAWEASLAAIRRDLEALRALVLDPARDLLGPVPAGAGQTLLREILLVADHTAYHVGQLVVVRRLQGNWPAS
jgi:hypothetical protein